MIDSYLDVVSLVVGLYRHVLEMTRLELNRLGLHDINNVRAMMLFNIGDAEMTVGELSSRGCYLGSNVSYNVKELVDRYLAKEHSVRDRRVVRIKLTDKGRDLWCRLSGMHRRYIEMLSTTMVTDDDLQNILVPLCQLEQFWIRASDPSIAV